MEPKLPGLKTAEIGLELHSKLSKSYHCLERYLERKYKDDEQLMKHLKALHHNMFEVSIHQVVNGLMMSSMEILASQKTIQRWTKMPGIRCESCGKFMKWEKVFEDGTTKN